MAATVAIVKMLFSTSSPEPHVGLSWNLVWSIGATSRWTVYINGADSISNMAAMVAILEIYFRLLLQNRWSVWAKICYGALGQLVDHEVDTNHPDSLSNMAAIAAILKINFWLLLQNRLSDWAEIWCKASGQLVDHIFIQIILYLISNIACHGSHLENLFLTSSPEWLVELSWNLVWSISTTNTELKFGVEHGTTSKF